MPKPSPNTVVKREDRATRLAEALGVVLIRPNRSLQPMYHSVAIEGPNTRCHLSMSNIEGLHPSSQASPSRTCRVCFSDPFYSSAKINEWLEANK